MNRHPHACLTKFRGCEDWDYRQVKLRMEIREFQRLIERIYYQRDFDRGSAGTFLWLVEEVGELARALRGDDKEAQAEEFADVFAWLVSLASLSEVDMEAAIGKYRAGCPQCLTIPCACPAKA